MKKILTSLSASTVLTVALGAISAPALRADMGHDHTEQTPTEEMHDGAMHEDGTHGNDAHGDGMHAEGDHGMHHSMLEIPEGQPVPEISLAIFPDPVAGWNLQIETENWAFAPEHVNQTSILTEGHAHLYVNGEKLTRIYSNWHYLPGLPPGDHVLTVGLNANGHEALMHNGELIEASVEVSVPEMEVGSE